MISGTRCTIRASASGSSAQNHLPLLEIVRSMEMNSARGTNLTIDGERLWGTLMETAKFGGTAKGGINRLTLTEPDRQVRDWFKAQAQALGCTVGVDDMGVIYARRPGRNNDVPPIALGSHLDTQPTGGKFDGNLGTLGGAFDRDWAKTRNDRAGVTFAQALKDIGYNGTERCGARKFSAFFELHIEQGPILEREDKEIGVVTGVQGVRWFECTFTGQDAHTGSTPMVGRRNALVGAAQAVTEV